MHDGQNIFDASTGFAGEWGVDECLDTLKKKCIVVGIDHGGNKRLVEYNPYNTNLFGKGEGKLYVEFLVKTLKPFIDSHYRTRKESKYTFIAGSSMGGIISYYAALKYPGVFSAAGVFSPAFHISKKDFLDEVNADNKKIPARMFFVCGEAESASMVPDMKEIATLTLNKHAVKEIVFSVPEARHTESFWQQQLPAFLKWLLN
jgi:predicted alpha/beta superfamily hydrolase